MVTQLFFPVRKFKKIMTANTKSMVVRVFFIKRLKVLMLITKSGFTYDSGFQ